MKCKSKELKVTKRERECYLALMEIVCCYPVSWT